MLCTHTYPHLLTPDTPLSHPQHWPTPSHPQQPPARLLLRMLSAHTHPQNPTVTPLTLAPNITPPTPTSAAAPAYALRTVLLRSARVAEVRAFRRGGAWVRMADPALLVNERAKRAAPTCIIDLSASMGNCALLCTALLSRTWL
eukprot:1158084-Pelagomonas_calceolata.AAC.8